MTKTSYEQLKAIAKAEEHSTRESMVINGCLTPEEFIRRRHDYFANMDKASDPTPYFSAASIEALYGVSHKEALVILDHVKLSIRNTPPL